MKDFESLNWKQKELAVGLLSVRWWIVRLSLVAFVVIPGMMAGCPVYNVWEQGLAGEAELKRAEQNRQIKINEAKALNESAEYQAQAEVKRAKGVAEANKIIGDSLKHNEAYLRYLWVNKLNENGQNVIYIPTEAGMPLLEAGKR